MKVKLINPNFNENYVEQLLKFRGVEDIEKFIKPDDDLIQSPSALDNIENGARLLKLTLETGKQICIVVDCDCDGYTSAAIIYQYIKKLFPETPINYIVHSGKQHGLEDCFQDIYDNLEEFGLVILPDSSSNDYEYHEKLKERNIRCLVIDHHDVDEPKFSSNAVIINNQLSPNYKNKSLTGAGVTYQFCKYLDKVFGVDYADEFIDLAALGIIGDMGSVLEMENRAFINKGVHFPTENYMLNCLYLHQTYSITGALQSCPDLVPIMNKKLTPIALSFYIVPLINAIVRSGTMSEKRRLFAAFINGKSKVPSGKRGAKGALEEVAKESIREAVNARSRQNRIKDKMTEQIEIKIHKYDLLENKVLFVRLEEEESFPPELNGLIAMTLSKKFNKPTIVGRLNDEGYIQGSARGLNESELTDFKQFLLDSGFFEYAQGHANAFGSSIKDSYLADFHKYANEKLRDYDFSEGYYEVNFQRMGMSLDLIDVINDISKYPKIWGQGCKTPLIYITDINLTKGDWNVVGSKNNTIRFSKNGVNYIKFFATDLIEEMSKYDEVKLNIIGEMSINEWNGVYTPQIIVKEVEVLDNQYGF